MGYPVNKEKRLDTVIGYKWPTPSKIIDWKYVSVPGGKGLDCRVYYDDSDCQEHLDQRGFKFYVVEKVSENKDWEPEVTWVECIYRGWGTFDGIRYIIPGDEQTGTDGEVYYPAMDAQIRIMTILYNMEQEFCYYDITQTCSRVEDIDYNKAPW